MKKHLITISLVTAAVLLQCFPSFAAGTWKSEETPGSVKWRYDNGDGTWAAGEWKWIDGNQDGIAECYYFDPSGWMLSDTMTPDHYTVNSDGAWTADGVVQTRISNGAVYTAAQEQSQGQSFGSETGADTYADDVKHVFSLVNQERLKNGKAQLHWNDTLAELAGIRAEELTKSFSHTRPDGRSFISVLDDHHVLYYAYGENAAMSSDSPEMVVKRWVESPTHHGAILNDWYTESGIAYRVSDGFSYWSQLFISEP